MFVVKKLFQLSFNGIINRFCRERLPEASCPARSIKPYDLFSNTVGSGNKNMLEFSSSQRARLADTCSSDIARFYDGWNLLHRPDTVHECTKELLKFVLGDIGLPAMAHR